MYVAKNTADKQNVNIQLKIVMKFLPYLKYIFLAVSIIIFTLYIFGNNSINKYTLVFGFVLIFSVPILHRYEKQRISHSSEEKKKN